MKIEERPWGNFVTLVDSSTHKVKSIIIHPGKRISLQRHRKRSEVWTCVNGIIMVQLGTDVNNLKHEFIYPGDSIKIPQGYIHRATSVGTDKDAIFIEVQTGTYFGEDDIERFEDDYGRIT